MKVQYVADDGKVFDTEAKCLDYERLRRLGGDNRFLEAVDNVLEHLVQEDDQGLKVIYFDSLAQMTDVGVAIAGNLSFLTKIYDDLSQGYTAASNIVKVDKKPQNKNKTPVVKKPVSARAIVKAALKSSRK